MRDQQLHDAVLAAPDDDAPRMVYADWLSDRGDPRGELIALQLAKRNSPEAAIRETDLWVTYRDQWTQPFGHMQVSFERGFAEFISLTVDDVPSLDVALLDAVIRHVEVRNIDGKLDELAPYLPRMRLRAFELLYGHVDDATLRPLFATGALADVEIFAIHSARLAASALDALVDAHLPNVRTLRLSSDAIQTGVIEYVLAAFPKIEHLDVAGNALAANDVTAILALGLPLRSLNLKHNRIGLDGALAIAQSPNAAGLEGLGLAGTDIGIGLEALIASPHLRQGMRLLLDGELLGLEARESRWVGSPPKALTNRFEIVIDGQPPY